MCLYPRLIRNPKYIKNEKNKGIIPEMVDYRTAYVPIGCGNCIECLNQKASEWRIRLAEEYKSDKQAKFITFTFSNQALEDLEKDAESNDANDVATLAVSRFLGRWRYYNRQSVKHWLITELGGSYTERIHLHGILWTEKENEYIADIWQYGSIFVGQYVNEKTVNYITKYLLKNDIKHKGFKPKILTSSGIGKGYMKSGNFVKNKYKKGETNEKYITSSGQKLALPIYYRNKRYSEEEREKLWIEKLDEEVRYVMSEKIDVSTVEGMNEYYRKLQSAQSSNIRSGYGDTSEEWTKKEYHTQLKKVNNK